MGGCGNAALLLLLYRFFVVFLSSWYVIRTRAYKKGGVLPRRHARGGENRDLDRHRDRDRTATTGRWRAAYAGLAWVSLEATLPARNLPNPPSFYVIRDESRRCHARGGYGVKATIEIVTVIASARRCGVLTGRRRPSWRRREMQQSWRGSVGCGVAATVGGVLWCVVLGRFGFFSPERFVTFFD